MQIFSVYGYSPPGEPLTDADKPEYSDWTHVRLEEAQMAKEHFEEVEKDYHVTKKKWMNKQRNECLIEWLNE